MTEGARDDCAGDLEDLVYTLQQDEFNAVDGAEKAVKRLKLARNPCGKLRAIFQRSNC